MSINKQNKPNSKNQNLDHIYYTEDEKKEYYKYNVTLLIILYTLQGLVIGFVLESLTLKLKEDFNYTDIGIYLLCSYPFSLKLFWSPIIDTYYIKLLGHRKTWIFLTHLITGVLFLIFYYKIDHFLKDKEIIKLAFCSFCLMFTIATQDIAVDALALTLMGEENCSMASSSQFIGQIIGSFISTSIFLSLNSVDFCNKFSYYEYKDYPILTYEQFIVIMALLFFASSVLILFFNEKRDKGN